MPATTSERPPLSPPGDAVSAPVIGYAIGQTLLQRLQHLGLVLWVSLSMPIAGSVYYLLGGTAPTAPIQQHYRLLGGLITEVSSLLVLWYVLSRQGRTWEDIGWKLEFIDVPRAVGLLIAASLVMYLALVPIQYTYWAYSGHFLARKSLNSVFGFGGSRRLAVIVSVAAQMSYHLYQGVTSAVALVFFFTVFSIYYVRTRRIVPVILAHLAVDLFALFEERSSTDDPHRSSA
jgi:hypothetical protein